MWKDWSGYSFFRIYPSFWAENDGEKKKRNKKGSLDVQG
jgi:hypothetical protein